MPASFERGHAAAACRWPRLSCAARVRREGLSANRFASICRLASCLKPARRHRHGCRPATNCSRRSRALDARHGGPGTRTSLSSQRGPARGSPARFATPRRWEWMLVGGGGHRRRSGAVAPPPARLRRPSCRCDSSSRAAPIPSRRRRRRSNGTWRRLAHLGGFALPLIREMASWPDRASWGDWLARFEQPRAARPRVPGPRAAGLADLGPMAAVGPVGLDEVRGGPSERLRLAAGRLAGAPLRPCLRRQPGAGTRAGRSASSSCRRGRARTFRRSARQDPLLPDAIRDRLDARLETKADRSARERLLLHLAVGAATGTAVSLVSAPRRRRVARARAVVLCARRGARRHRPHPGLRGAGPGRPGRATRRCAWPAPPDPDATIDSQEHDLAVLRQLPRRPSGRDRPRPRAAHAPRRYALRRTVTSAAGAYGRDEVDEFDGLVQATDQARAPRWPAAAHARPTRCRRCSGFAPVRIKFLLADLHRLHAAEQPGPLQRLDPFTKGEHRPPHAGGDHAGASRARASADRARDAAGGARRARTRRSRTSPTSMASDGAGHRAGVAGGDCGHRPRSARWPGTSPRINAGSRVTSAVGSAATRSRTAWWRSDPNPVPRGRPLSAPRRHRLHRGAPCRHRCCS